MFSSFRLIPAVLLMLAFATWIYPQGQSSDRLVAQLQGTLFRLQTEIKGLKDTIAQLRSNQKTDTPAAETAQPATPETRATRAKQARAAYNDARRLEGQRLYRAAVKIYADAIQLDPSNDAAFLHRGYSYHQLGDDTAAIADFTQSLTLQPNNSRAYLARASANATMGRRAPALDDVNEAIRRDPKSAEAYLLRGRLFQQQGDSQPALADFGTAQSLSPKSEQPYLASAETHLHDGQADQAINDCDAAVRVNPNSFGAYLCRAQAYIQMGKSERAVEEIGQASRAAQSLDLPLAFLNDTWRNLDGARAAANPPANPIPAAPTPSILTPAGFTPASPNPVVPVQAAPAAVPTNVTKPAPAKAPPVSAPVVRTASNVTVSSPAESNVAESNDDPDSMEQIARGFTNEHNYAAALALLNRVIALEPMHAPPYNARGFTHLLMRHYDLAINDFSEAIRLNPDYGNAYHNRAVARRAVGDRAHAAQDDVKANALTPNTHQGTLTAQR